MIKNEHYLYMGLFTEVRLGILNSSASTSSVVGAGFEERSVSWDSSEGFLTTVSSSLLSISTFSASAVGSFC